MNIHYNNQQTTMMNQFDPLMLSVHIPVVNPSIIFNIMGKEQLKTFDYIQDIGPNNAVESMIQEFIAKQFKYQRIGKLYRVDLVRKFNTKNQLPYYSAFCHFDEWTTGVVGPRWCGKTFSENIRRGVPCRLYYEEKSYWVLTLNQNPLPYWEARNHRIIHDQVYYINRVLNVKYDISPLGKTLEELLAMVEHLHDLIQKIQTS